MRIIADRTRCAGHGICEALLPDVFQVDESGKVQIRVEQVAESDCADAELAVDSCPVEALRQSPD
ncbi:ferredoxin [Nocardia sp. CA-107356]|uniref:ferredoxin n=1 Tax=Nocardia sp. CA-107356 TaxID=3239972 RepID=UPI003D92F2E4